MPVSCGNLPLQLLLAAACLEYFQLVGADLSSNFLNRFKRATCSRSEFMCQNSQCINKHLQCDGIADCSDKSDETAALCSSLGIICPGYAFQCAYGACVDGHAKCNGIQDCVDNSDETAPDCASSVTPPRPTPQTQAPTTKPSTSCLGSQFRCSNGQCIDKFNQCDGKKDCSDSSDETEAKCKDFPCPNRYFRCDYGACVASDARCNGKWDCADGSDEKPGRCPGTTSTKRPTPRPTNGCKVPPSPPGGKYYLHTCSPSNTSAECAITEDSVLPLGSWLRLDCKEGFALPLSTTNRITCVWGQTWSPSTPPTCRRTCEALSVGRPNLEFECTLTEFKEEEVTTKVPCNKPMPRGTKVIVRCPSYFKPKLDQEQVLRCQENGIWDQPLAILSNFCEALCGIRGNFEQTIFNGSGAKLADFPWHVGIYWFDKDSGGDFTYQYKCGGSLISEKTVLTAAHCGHNNDQKYPTTQMYVALGKEKSTWELEDDIKTQRFSVAEFIPSPYYSGSNLFYVYDIALIILDGEVQFKHSVYPVCINRVPSRFRNPNAVGLVPGWGNTGSADVSEDLLFAKIPFMPEDKCKKLLKPEDHRIIAKDKFCGGYDRPGPRTKSGDSGGGLVYKDEGKSSLFYVVGVVSTTYPKDDFWVGFYTNVSFHYDWIMNRKQPQPALFRK